MTDTKPRALTDEQQGIAAAASASAHASSAPMRVPPGMNAPIESLDPTAVGRHGEPAVPNQRPPTKT